MTNQKIAQQVSKTRPQKTPKNKKLESQRQTNIEQAGSPFKYGGTPEGSRTAK